LALTCRPGGLTFATALIVTNLFVTIMFVSARSNAPVSRRDRPAKPPLTREGIIAVTLRLLQAEGLEQVTMRRLARELDTGPASLYVYFDNVADLHGAVLDQLLSEVDLRPDAPPGGWRPRLVELLAAYTELLFAHPSLARSVLTLRPRPSGPNYMRLVDSVLVLLRAGGVPAGQAAWGVNLLLQMAVATAAEHGTRKEAAGDGAAEEADEQSWREASAGEHPGIAWASQELFTGGHHRLRWAFEVLIAGIAASEIPPYPPP
jgi:AcrR family transcriptional regulator